MQEEATASMAKHISLNQTEPNKTKSTYDNAQRAHAQRTWKTKRKYNNSIADAFDSGSIVNKILISYSKYSTHTLERMRVLLAQKWTIFNNNNDKKKHRRERKKQFETDSLAHRENDKHETQIMNWFMIFCWPVYVEYISSCVFFLSALFIFVSRCFNFGYWLPKRPVFTRKTKISNNGTFSSCRCFSTIAYTRTQTLCFPNNRRACIHGTWKLCVSVSCDAYRIFKRRQNLDSRVLFHFRPPFPLFSHFQCLTLVVCCFILLIRLEECTLFHFECMLNLKCILSVALPEWPWLNDLKSHKFIDIDACMLNTGPYKLKSRAYTNHLPMVQYRHTHARGWEQNVC